MMRSKHDHKKQKPIADRWHSLSLRKKIFLVYAVVFALIIVIGFFGFFTDGNTFVRSGDSWNQHYRALVYIGQYFRSIARNLLGGNFTIPTWDFTIGEGTDIITSLQYYGLGDPLTLLSGFVPTDYTWVLYGFLIILRMYLAGVAFIAMCLYFKKHNLYAVLSGALVYVFSAWSIASLNHTMFAVPAIYLPLIVIGIEKILSGKGGLTLAISVFLLSISNVYFCAVTALLGCVYSILRLAFVYKKNFRAYIRPLFRLVLYSLLGIALSAVIFLPVTHALLQSGRSDTETSTSILWPASYYQSLPSSLLQYNNADSELRIGVLPIAVIALLLAFRYRKQHPFAITVILIMFIPLLFSSAAKITNFGLYADNRWSFAFTLTLAYLTTLTFTKISKMSNADIKYLLVCIVIYAIACLSAIQSNTKYAFLSLFVTLVTILIPTTMRESTRQKTSLLLMISVIISAALFCIDINGRTGQRYAYSNTKSQSDVANIKNNELSATKSLTRQLDDNEFCRHSGSNIGTNIGITNNIPSTSYYWSTANPYMSDMYRQLGLLDNHPHRLNTLDNRAGLLSLSSVKYYAMPKRTTAAAPYGFKYTKTIDVGKKKYKAIIAKLSESDDGVNEQQKHYVKEKTVQEYDVFVNEYALPIGYTYKQAIPSNKLDGMSMINRESAMLQAVALSDYDGDANCNSELKFDAKEIDYDISPKQKDGTVTYGGNKFIVTDKNATAQLKVPKHMAGEFYVIVNSLQYQQSWQNELYSDDRSTDPSNIYNQSTRNLLSPSAKHPTSNESTVEYASISVKSKSLKTSKDIGYKTEHGNWYADRHDFAIGLGYSDGDADIITIAFPYPGIYSYDSLSVIVQPMDSYADQINALREDVLENVKFSDNTVSGTLQLEEEKWLALSIPYSEGWELFVDGEQQPLYRANIQFMAAKIQPGEHEIKLVYETPMLKIGLIVSSTASMSILTILFIKSRKRHHNSKTKA